MLFRKYIQVILIGLFSFWSYIGPANAEFEWLFPWTSTAYDTLHEAEQVLMSYPGSTWPEYHEYMFSERIDVYSNKIRRQYGLLEWEPLSSHSIYGYAFGITARNECLDGIHCAASEAEAYRDRTEWPSSFYGPM